jgi:hypothetical protein
MRSAKCFFEKRSRLLVAQFAQLSDRFCVGGIAQRRGIEKLTIGAIAEQFFIKKSKFVWLGPPIAVSRYQFLAEDDKRFECELNQEVMKVSHFFSFFFALAVASSTGY